MLTRGRLWLLIPAALLATGFFVPGIFSESTRVAFIESEEIMKRYYDWQQAQQRIDGAANQWKKELDGMQAALRAKEDSLERYRLIWSAPEKEAATRLVSDGKKKVQEFWSRKFGPTGSEYATLTKDVLTPIYEKVFSVIQEVAKEEKYDYVFDKTGEVLLLYANPAHDLTRDVMEKLGIKDTAGAPARSPLGARPGSPGMPATGAPGSQRPPGDQRPTGDPGVPPNPDGSTPQAPNKDVPPAPFQDPTQPH
jgi:outer membrane protein